MMVPVASPRAVKGTVLLVDDDEAVTRAFARVVRLAGYDVTVALGASPAIEAVRQQSFDVIVSDIQMPGATGLDLLRAVRQHDPDVPVILLTGSPRLETAMAAVELGALQYLLKPVDTSVLVGAIARARTLHRLALIKREALAVSGLSDDGAGDRATLEMRLDNALGTLWMAFQPILRPGGAVFGYEALLRSREPSLSSPDLVISAAERLGRLHDLGRQVRATTVRSFREAPADALLFVNLHTRDLLDPSLYGNDEPLLPLAHRVVLEITERASLDIVKDVPARIGALRKRGFRIAVDDLGAGYAGLTSFTQLEPEFVKLDMSLVHDVQDSTVKQRVIASLAELCHELDLQVIAEGVEVEAECRQVCALGCDLLQGYWFARPQAGFEVQRAAAVPGRG